METLTLMTKDIPYDLGTFNLRQNHGVTLFFSVDCLRKRFEFRQKADLLYFYHPMEALGIMDIRAIFLALIFYFTCPLNWCLCS